MVPSMGRPADPRRPTSQGRDSRRSGAIIGPEAPVFGVPLLRVSSHHFIAHLLIGLPPEEGSSCGQSRGRITRISVVGGMQLKQARTPPGLAPENSDPHSAAEAVGAVDPRAGRPKPYRGLERAFGAPR